MEVILYIEDNGNKIFHLDKEEWWERKKYIMVISIKIYLKDLEGFLVVKAFIKDIFIIINIIKKENWQNSLKEKHK